MTQPATQHVPAMLAEVLAWLDPRPGQILVDGTLGGGGHAAQLAQHVSPGGLVVGLDRDPAALARAQQQLLALPVKLVHANFADLPEALAELEIAAVDGVLLDLGMSSDQLADGERGFSFDSTGPLDLRFDVSAGEPAWQVLARLQERALADLIYQYGEERRSRRIARNIVAERGRQPIRTASQLASLVRRSLRSGPRQRIDPATRTFQALRIAVNDELGSLERALRRIPDCLRPGGRLAVISFHSLEDRLVKRAFRGDPRYEPLTAKPASASAAEAQRNPRARSAKLRVAQRTDTEVPKAVTV